jgi:flagellar basal-body rod protein FlgB
MACTKRQLFVTCLFFVASPEPNPFHLLLFLLVKLLLSALRMLDPIASRLEHYMDLLSKRQRLTAANIANADTPGYRARDIDFQFEFMSLAQGANPNVVEVQGLNVKNDGNNVSIDRESRLLAENALRFNLAANLLKGQVRAVRSALQEGRS